jgi:hypothetical protein
MNFLRLNTNMKIILGVVISVFAIYLLYSQVYTRNREENMIQTRFRVLDNMGENVKAKMKSYLKNAQTYYSEVYKENASDPKQVNIKDTISKYSNTYNADLIYYKTVKDSSNRIVVRQDSLFFNCRNLEFYLPNDIILKNIERPDDFDHTLIIAEGNILYCSSLMDLKLIFIDSPKKESTEKGFHFIPPGGSDTLFLPLKGNIKSATIQTDRCYDIKLSDGRYKLFLKPIKIDQEEWFIGGLVRKASFDRDKQSIPPWLIIALSLTFVLILLSLPFVKLWVMSKTELVGKSTIFHIALSLLVGFTFVIFYLFFQQHYFARSNQRIRNLKQLSGQISDSIAGELQQIQGVLDNVDRTLYAKRALNNDTIQFTNVLGDTADWKIARYPYFDYIYWLDSTGMQVAEITPFSFNEKLSKYDFRNYFKNYDQWYANFQLEDTSPYRIPDTVKFYMESIVSVTSGDYKVAYSTASRFEKQRIVMTGRFNSLIDPILPKGYSFCIIDPSGKVWFHSNKYQNLAENFIQECGNDRGLQAAIYSEIPKILDVKYYNIPNRLYIQPLKGLPLFIVTMYDIRLEYAYQAQSFISTSMLVTALFVFFFLQLILFLLLKKWIKSANDTDDNLKTEFSKLKVSKANDYYRLIWLILYALIILYPLIYLMPPALALVSVFMLSTILITLLLIRLHEYEADSPIIIIYKIFNALILVILFIISRRVSNEDHTIYGMFLFLLLIMTGLNFIPGFKIKESWKMRTDFTYSWLIFLLLMVFGIAPALRFYQVGVNIENENQVRLAQLELAKSRESRNKIYETYYRRISDIKKEGVDDYRDNVHRSRMDLGEYCAFWYNTKLSATSAYSSKTSRRAQEVDSLINMTRPLYSDPLSVYSKYLSIDSIPGRQFNWKYFDNTLELNYESPTEDIDHKSFKKRYISSVIIPKSILFPFGPDTRYMLFKVPAFYLIIFLVLLSGFGLILLSTRKLYGISLMDEEKLHLPHDQIQNYLQSGNPVLIVNPSGITGFQDLLEIIKTDYKTEDFEWQASGGKDATKNLLVADLMKERFDPEKLEVKLDTLIESLEKHPRFLVVTEINPQKVLLFYEERARVGKFATRNDKNPDEQQTAYRKTYYKFRALLNKLAKVDVPLDYSGKNISKTRAKTPAVLFHELGDTYCRNILENCSPEELIVLLDLSGDTLANVTNVKVVTRLLNKGLLIKNHSDIVIKYKALEHYLDKNFTSRYRKELLNETEEDSGMWAGYKTAILLVSVVLLAFIFISNQQFLSNITKLVATIGASLLAITNLFNMVVRKNS